MPDFKPAHRYNWKPDLPDLRDHAYTLTAPKKLPEKIDLRDQCPPVVNQGQIGSCTANALAGAFGFLELRELKAASGPEVFSPTRYAPASRLFIYYNERSLEGTPDKDSGARLRDGVKVLAKLGACKETTWKYETSLLFERPSGVAYDEAQVHRISEYLRASSLTEIKDCLAAGYPVAFGFTVYESFESPEVAKTGVMPLPAAGERVLGGHAVLAVGYDDHQQVLIVRNSWGSTWGQGGYFTMPYDFIVKLKQAQDFWTIRR